MGQIKNIKLHIVTDIKTCNISKVRMFGRLIPRHAKTMVSLVPKKGFSAIPVSSTKLLTNNNNNNNTTSAIEARSFHGIPQIEQLHFATTIYLSQWMFCGVLYRVYFEPEDIREAQEDVIQLMAPEHLKDPEYFVDCEEEGGSGY